MKLFLLSDIAKTLDHLHRALTWAAHAVNGARVWVWTRENKELLRGCNARPAARTRFC